MYSEIINGGLTVLNRAGDFARRGGMTDSLIDFTQVGRVEPVVLIEQNAMHLESIGEVQQSLLSIFAGYYLQAASMMNNIGNVRVLERLDALNPNRSPVNAGLSNWLIATEDASPWLIDTQSYAHGLPFPSDNKLKLAIESGAGFGGMGMSGSKTSNNNLGAGQGGQGSGHNKQSKNTANKGSAGAMGGMGVQAAPTDRENIGTTTRGTGSGTSTQALSKGEIGRTMTELANLSVGKAYEINISDGQHSYPVQINIRLIASMLPTQDLVHILATGSDDNSFKERWHGWRSGRLAFWKDLVFCNDLIDKHRTDLMKDKTGTITNMNRANLGNTLTSVITGQPSIASSSQMAVLTKDSAENLELRLEGKLAKFDIRQRMMKQTSLMILAVVDEVDYNNVTFYHRGIVQPTVVRLKDLRASNKGSGPDVGDILKALMGGHAPAL